MAPDARKTTFPVSPGDASCTSPREERQKERKAKNHAIQRNPTASGAVIIAFLKTIVDGSYYFSAGGPEVPNGLGSVLEPLCRLTRASGKFYLPSLPLFAPCPTGCTVLAVLFGLFIIVYPIAAKNTADKDGPWNHGTQNLMPTSQRSDTLESKPTQTLRVPKK